MARDPVIVRVSYNGDVRHTLAVSWLVIFIAFVAVLAIDRTNAGAYVYVDFVSLIPQWLFVFPILLLAATFWGIFNSRQLRLAVIVLLIVTTRLWLPLLDVVWQKDVVAGPRAFTVMSWNTAQWNHGRRDDFIALLKAHPSDVYLLQEVHFKTNPELHGYIMENFGGYQAGHYGEFFTLSKFPLNCNVSEKSGVLLGCTALTESGPITFVNVHLKRPFHVTNFRTFEDFDVRWQQYTALQMYISQIQGPVMIAGDFNTTANYPFVRELSARFERNDPAGTFLWPHTFPANFPYMRIDYQFVSAPYTFCGYGTVKEPSLSDHVGIIGSVCTKN